MRIFNNPTVKKISNFLLKKEVVIGLYILLALIAGAKQYTHHSFNNYLIYKYVYWHTVDSQNLYLNYSEYLDSNHYGPVFSLFVAPFALLPDGLGMILWNVANVAVLLWGIFSLPLSLRKQILMAWICAHEALTALFSFQFNIALTGTILLGFSYLIKKKEVQSAFFIAFGTLVKLYGIVGLAFFFFTKNKIKFILGGVLAFAVLFALPMLISSPNFVMQSYYDWYSSLSHKNDLNASLTSFQDISLMGIVRRVTADVTIPNTPFLLLGIVLFGLPYIRIKQYQHIGFRLMLLASTLIFTVIFSSGSESPTYIIAFAGVAIWFLVQSSPKNGWIIGLLVFAFVLTSLSPTDIFPGQVKEFIRLYSLKALPCTIIWLTLIYQMMTVDFQRHLIADK
ncbi:hypothetical protein DHW03_14955 [Pedobacter yonginense]|uniref:DUF2029 domain-containing protein n=1 Tax=Pedobacter yonginense TaxID=651869 RepID=A0A317EI63_9SPHI|nr:glycosyltransferase family 87 protein [Pedobacter yonginense]PWS26095.1 hypothetical protein DHW03_14955 [Pedobacter yonginense]